MPEAQPVIIILAAGKGERFRAGGGTTYKLEALLAGKPVLQHVLAAAQASGLPWHLVRPQGGTRGMGESIALGVKATPDAAGWLILPGDLPLITAASLQRVAQALNEKPVVVPYYQQRHGHPVGFRREYFDSLTLLTGDEGAKAVVQAARACADVFSLALNDPGIVQDIDVPEDLAAAEHDKNNAVQILRTRW
ncbi:NTP transferase domain-containing protein [Cronobacter sakazakii]|uniref:nucleotidyltransferase family protein n=1 Tax=Cronobacter TaxID=413496 RepID=UPI000BE9AB45|nr:MULTISPECIES: nucleotidyltransferase family protein [Cronobacter]EJJ0548281.1 nucleotidyltransferase family protein [Cronobacter sakazakii]ELY6083894.1 nucleotidyltransferase family protein [Cronobacter sakazakii]MBF4934733.1 nucleotidyltransferase family protein [Cronobacter sakazakii]MBK4113052.1 nucleotidyltransferase family protein [Cronobacter sakazakii]MDI7679711.1 nucleotidyltransferase family protein [Cronobacter sakazakii]